MAVRWSEAEWRLMRAVWRAAAGRGHATARDVLDALGPGKLWAYTTAKTMLDRLVAKGALARVPRAKPVAYRPRIQPDEAERREVDQLKSGVFGGEVAPLVRHLMADERVSRREREWIAELLGRLEREGGDTR